MSHSFRHMTSNIRFICSLSVLAMLSASPCFGQETKQAEDREARLLNKACRTYENLKENSTPTGEWTREDSTSVGFCMGYFRGFMSASADLLLGPDEEGRMMEFTIVHGTTFVQAIHVFLTATAEKPELLREDAGVTLIAVLRSSGLATYTERKELHVKGK